MKIKLISILVLLVVVIFNFNYIKINITKEFPNLRFVKYLFKKDSLLNNINNDYNVKFLPETEFIKFDLIKKKLIFNDDYYKPRITNSISYSNWGTFYLDIYKDTIFISDFLGNIYFFKESNLVDKSINEIPLLNVSHNLKNISNVADITIIKNEIFISYNSSQNNCNKSYVSFAELGYKNLQFKNIFESKLCSENGATGKLQFYIHNNKEGILISTSSGAYNSPDSSSQDVSSIFGKILFIGFQDKLIEVFSLGHRVIQGLVVKNNLILATEHGPRGGDEINKIFFNNNYGWPISSYGERYDFKYNDLPYYKKNHESFGFEEPIYYFTPSIGISEIIDVPDEYLNFFENPYIISSLNGKSIFFISFDKVYSKIKTIEKIFLNERIRDLKYLDSRKLVLLALEENGEIGILEKR